MIRLVALSAFVFLTGCQVAPTKTGETQTREFGALISKTSRPIVVTDNTVILDTRSSFDYGLNRVLNSRHFPWQNLAEPGGTGEVLRDARQAALRLSLQGMRPDTAVVIIGYGVGGQGEEGRLAWNLLYLGFQDVQISSIEPFRKTLTQQVTAQAINEPEWKAEPKSELLATSEELNHWAKNAKDRLDKKVFLIDARNQREFFEKSKANPDVGATNIEWKEFFTTEGRPNPAIKGKIQALGIGLNDQIIVFDRNGVRSGAAAYALLALGFTRVKNATSLPSPSK